MRSPLLGGLALVISMATITHAEVASGGVQAAFSEGLPLTKASGIQRSTNLKSAMQPSTPTFPPGKKEGGGVGNLLQRMQQLSPLLRNKNHQRSSPPAAGVDVDVLTERAAAKQPQAVANHGDGEVMPWKDFLELKKSPAATAAPPLASSSSASPKIGLDCGWSCIPHPSKVHRGGEDVHIVSRAGGCTLTGVLDGVGGWAELGVDPAEYARRLAALMVDYFADNANGLEDRERPLLDIVRHAFGILDEAKLAGSCTCCLSLLLPSGRLHVLNLGDSGLQVVREGESVFKTTEQQHYFNCPFQLGMGSDDRPEDADYFILEDLAPDDAVILATDGVWDNLYNEALVSLIDDTAASPEALARRVSEKSHLLGRDSTYVSPFAANAQRQGLRFHGGKLDDVTVVVSRVCAVKKVKQKSAQQEGKRGEEEGGGGGVGSPVSSVDEDSEDAGVLAH